MKLFSEETLAHYNIPGSKWGYNKGKKNGKRTATEILEEIERKERQFADEERKLDEDDAWIRNELKKKALGQKTDPNRNAQAWKDMENRLQSNAKKRKSLQIDKEYTKSYNERKGYDRKALEKQRALEKHAQSKKDKQKRERQQKIDNAKKKISSVFGSAVKSAKSGVKSAAKKASSLFKKKQNKVIDT